jgi:DNA-binding Lrp family transcriptional regulator
MEENKVVSAAEGQESKIEAKKKAEQTRASKLLDEIVKENRPLTGPQMVEVEKRVGMTPTEGWAVLEVFRKSGVILKFKTKNSHRAPALYALPEQRNLVDVKRWAFEVKDEGSI